MRMWGIIVLTVLSLCTVGVGIRNCISPDPPTPKVEGSVDVGRLREREAQLQKRGEEVRDEVRGAMEESCDWASTPIPGNIVRVLDGVLCDDATGEGSTTIRNDAPVRGGKSALSH